MFKTAEYFPVGNLAPMLFQELYEPFTTLRQYPLGIVIVESINFFVLLTGK